MGRRGAATWLFLPVGLGVALGVVCATAVLRTLESMLLGISPYDARSWIMAGSIFVTTLAVGVVVPVRRLRRIDPAAVLKTS